MRRRVLAISIFLATLRACAAARPTTTQTTQTPSETAARRTIFVPVMDGYENDVVNAFRAEELPVEIVTEKSKADLQVRPTFANSRQPEKGTGHEPFSWLDVVQVETNRTLVSYPFLWTDYEVTRSRDAQEFARELKNKLVVKTR